ncbi:MAG: hypothetical protein ACHQZS_05325 [Candidatus Binatales bacterium]
MDKRELIVRLMADSLSKAQALSKIALDRKPELRRAAAKIVKAVKASRQRIEALTEVAHRNGKLDKATIDRSLDRILKAAQKINREVDDLLAKARR